MSKGRQAGIIKIQDMITVPWIRNSSNVFCWLLVKCSTFFRRIKLFQPNIGIPNHKRTNTLALDKIISICPTFVIQLNLNCARVLLFSCAGAKHCSSTITLCATGSGLHFEESAVHINESVFPKSIESVVKTIQSNNMWVTNPPSCDVWMRKLDV